MNVTAKKYNPGFLSDEELVVSFCVRASEFESIIEMLRDCRGSSNPHQIVLGPRGSGKTSLLLRVAAEIRRDVALSSGFFPVVFAEESYEVSTAGEFWLECLSRLAIQAPFREGDADLHRTYNELRTIADDRMLEERCLAALLDFSDREGKRLVLFVENLNTMFRDMTDPDAGWRLRKILQTEPRIVLLASATSRFDQIDNPDQALYDLFRITSLRPLETQECAVLWETVSGQGSRPETIRSLRILTGGNPRLLVIVARFGAKLSFRELMADLLNLVDDHTEYFRSHLELLPAQERRVYLALADLWKPATTKEIADRARIETSKCSAQLARLIERGSVEVAGGTSRRKQYYLTERMYNIYYLLRRPRGPDRLVDSLIRFMESFYSPLELRNIGIGIVREALSLNGEMRALYETAIERLLMLPKLSEYRSELLEEFPVDISGSPARSLILLGGTKQESSRVETTPSRKLPARLEPIRSPETVGRKLLERGVELIEQKRPEEALEVFEQVIRRYSESPEPVLLEFVAKALIGKGGVFWELGRIEEELAVCEEVVRLFEDSEEPALIASVAFAMFKKGVSLDVLGRPAEALETYDDIVQRYGASEQSNVLREVGKALSNKGGLLGTAGRLEEALEIFDEIVHRFGSNEDPALVEIVTISFIDKGYTLSALDRPEEALTAYELAILHPGKIEKPSILEMVAGAFVLRGSIFIKLGRSEEALASYEEAIRRFETHGEFWRHEVLAQAFLEKGLVLVTLNRLMEAIESCDEVVRRIGESEEPILVYMAADATYRKGNAFLAMNLPIDALAAFDEALRRSSKAEKTVIPMIEAKTLLSRGIAFDWLNQPKEALMAYDEVVRRFGESNDPRVSGPVASALERKIPILENANQLSDAQATYEEMTRRVGDDAPEYNVLIERSLIERADCELTFGRHRSAIAAATLALEKCLPESVENRLRAYFIRATAALSDGDINGCERDIETILMVLPDLDSLPQEFLRSLMEFSIKLEPTRIRKLIEVSASADLLLPLATALAEEAGEQPRVAREVEEVARDIQNELKLLRNSVNAENLLTDDVRKKHSQKLAEPSSRD